MNPLPLQNTTAAVFPKRALWPWIRLLLAALFFGVSLLALFRAPTTQLWILAIGATEFGHWFLLGPLALLLVPPRTRGRLNSTTRALCILAAVLFLSPALRAWHMASTVKTQIAAAFPTAPSHAAPFFSLHELWLGKKSGPVPMTTLPFGTHGLSLDFYRALAPSPAPCLLVLHTGGWNNGSPREFLEFNARMARRGVAVAALEYRLAPRFAWPAQRDDVLEALAFLKSRAPALGLDAHRFVLLGRSAGGQIAESVAYGAHDPDIRGLIAFYAPADLHFAFQYARSDDILNSLQLLTDYLGGTPETRRPNYDSASAFGLVDAQSPPTLLLHGRRDELVWFLQSQRLAAQLQKAGVPHYFLALDWATHAFDFNPRGPGGQLAQAVVDQFLDTVIAPTPR